ncbi:MAG TPA: hypothetical protein VGK56_09020, partial [Anaerolineales bacterium]
HLPLHGNAQPLIRLGVFRMISEYYVSSAPELSYPKTSTLAEAIDLNQDGTLKSSWRSAAGKAWVASFSGLTGRMCGK